MPDAGTSLEQGVDAIKAQLDAARPESEAPIAADEPASDPAAPIDAHIAELAAELTAASSDPAPITEQVHESLDEAAQAVEAVKQAAEDLIASTSADPAQELASQLDATGEPSSIADAASVPDPEPIASEPAEPPAPPVDTVPGAAPASPEIESLDRELAQLADDMVAGEVAPASAIIEPPPEPVPEPPDPEPEAPPPAPPAPTAVAPAPRKPTPPPAPAPEPKRSLADALAPLGLRVATAFAAPIRGLPPAKRGVIGYIAIYTLFVGACASAYVLVFRSTKPPEPIEAVHETTDLHDPKPTFVKRSFYSPDDPNAPKPEAAGDAHGAKKDDGHGAKKDDAHGAKKDAGHGAPKKDSGHGGGH